MSTFDTRRLSDEARRKLAEYDLELLSDIDEVPDSSDEADEHPQYRTCWTVGFEHDPSAGLIGYHLDTCPYFYSLEEASKWIVDNLDAAWAEFDDADETKGLNNAATESEQR